MWFRLRFSCGFLSHRSASTDRGRSMATQRSSPHTPCAEVARDPVSAPFERGVRHLFPPDYDCDSVRSRVGLLLKDLLECLETRTFKRPVAPLERGKFLLRLR